jgi:hypothetical protein
MGLFIDSRCQHFVVEKEEKGTSEEKSNTHCSLPLLYTFMLDLSRPFYLVQGMSTSNECVFM